MSLEGLDGHLAAESTHVYLLISAARGKARVVLPVDVKGRRRVKRELLLTRARLRIPNDRRLQCKHNS